MTSINAPMISVAVVTYNHEQFIAECIESILNQSLDSGVEIIIGEDASTDRTREILNVYAAENPGIVKPLLYESNVGGRQNYINVLRHCSGKYIAVLDGDDRMLPGKLDRQLSYMEEHPECSVCAHALRVFQSDTNKTIAILGDGVPYIDGDLNTLVRYGTYFGNASVMYRREHLDVDEFERLHKTDVVGDWLLHMLVARHGAVHFIPEVFGEYRKHERGFSSQTSLVKNTFEDRLKILEVIKEFGVDIDAWRYQRALLLFNYSRRMHEDGDYSCFSELVSESVHTKSLGMPQKIFWLFRRMPRVLVIMRAMLKVIA